MKKILTALMCLLSPLLAFGQGWESDYASLSGSIRQLTFPDRSFDITRYGASPKATAAKNQQAINKAIEACSKAGGGKVVVPSGTWNTGAIRLKSHVNLVVEKDATLLFAFDTKLYPLVLTRWEGLDLWNYSPCIYAYDERDVAITGEGTIDGNGRWWRAVKRNKVSDEEWKAFRRMGGTVADCGKLWYPYDLDHADNVAEGYKAQEKLRTHLIRLTDCERVLVGGVTLQNAPKFHLVPQRCRQVIIDGVTVRCPWNAQNGDGIDLMQSKDVLVTRCTVDVGDDGICLKAGAGQAALEAGPTARVLVCDNTVYHAHGGFVIGSEFSGGMEDIVVVRNLFSGTDTGLRFKSGSGRGGKTSNIFVSDIVMTDISGEAIIFETTYVNVSVGEAGDHDFSGTFLPDFSGIRIKNVTCREARTAISAHGDPSTIHDNLVEDSVFFYSEKGLDADDPGMVTLRGVKLQTY